MWRLYVLLLQQKTDERDETSTETKATYDKIKDFVGDNYQHLDLI